MSGSADEALVRPLAGRSFDISLAIIQDPGREVSLAERNGAGPWSAFRPVLEPAPGGTLDLRACRFSPTFD